MPQVHVNHAVFVEVPVDLPTSCPNCHAWFEDEDENNLLVLHVAMAQGRTSLEIGTSNLRAVLDGYDDTNDEDGRVVGFGCNRCKEPVIWTHFRTWILEAMMPMEATRLRTLLYDGNVLDEFIKEKVFGPKREPGYQGNCEACNIEAGIGTREIPHPIDARLHTCKEP